MKPQRHEHGIGPQQHRCVQKHAPAVLAPVTPRALERAAGLFRAMGDGPRLRLLHLLLSGEVCVGELVTAVGEKFSTVSQRLRVLRSEGLVTRRRDASHVFYALADDHVRGLVANALAHADELNGSETPSPSSEDDE